MPRKTDDPDFIAAGLERDRAALSDSIAALRDRVSPEGLLHEGMRQFGQGAARSARASARVAGASVLSSPWLAAGVAGLGLAWFALVRRKPAGQAEEPGWLTEAAAVQDRAAALAAEIDRAGREGLIDGEELAESHADLKRATETDLRRSLLRGLEGLDPEERDAALAVREARAARRLGRAVGRAARPARHPVLSGALAAGAAAAAAALVQRMGEGGAARPAAGAGDSLLRELRETLDRAMARLDAAEDRDQEPGGR